MGPKAKPEDKLHAPGTESLASDPKTLMFPTGAIARDAGSSSTNTSRNNGALSSTTKLLMICARLISRDRVSFKVVLSTKTFLTVFTWSSTRVTYGFRSGMKKSQIKLAYQRTPCYLSPQGIIEVIRYHPISLVSEGSRVHHLQAWHGGPAPQNSQDRTWAS